MSDMQTDENRKALVNLRHSLHGAHGSARVKELGYKPEGRGFETRLSE
jgi:hypothetical protein